VPISNNVIFDNHFCRADLVKRLDANHNGSPDAAAPQRQPLGCRNQPSMRSGAAPGCGWLSLPLQKQFCAADRVRLRARSPDRNHFHNTVSHQPWRRSAGVSYFVAAILTPRRCLYLAFLVFSDQLFQSLNGSEVHLVGDVAVNDQSCHSSIESQRGTT